MDERADIDRADAVAAVEAALVAWVIGAGEGDGAERDAVSLDRDGSWSSAELSRAEELVEAKYRDDGWVRTQPGNGGA
jgi:lipoate-protein ligase A